MRLLALLLLHTAAALPDTEVAALQALEAAMGPDWWDDGDPCDEWTGVACANNTQVTDLDLSDLNPVGDVPWDVLLELPNLRRFAVEACAAVTGPLPEADQLPPALQELALSSCSFTGTVPASLGVLELDALRIDRNQISGPLPPQAARHLSLDQNSLGGPIPELGDKVEKAYLGDSALTGSLPDADWSPASLQQLYLGSNELTGTLPETLPAALTVLVVKFNEALTGTLPATIPASLHVVDISSTAMHGTVPDSWWDTLSYLEASDVQGLSGTLPDSIAGMRQVDVIGTNFTGSIPANISESSSLNIFNIAQSRIAGPLPPLPDSLDEFYSDDCALTGALPSQLPARMAYFSVANTELHGAIPDLQGDVDILLLAGVALTGDFPASYCDAQLEQFSIAGAGLTLDLDGKDDFFACLGSTMVVMDLSGNNFLGSSMCVRPGRLAPPRPNNTSPQTLDATYFPTLLSIDASRSNFSCGATRSFFCWDPTAIGFAKVDACGSVPELNATSVTGSSVDVSWEPTGDADVVSYLVYVSGSGRTPSCDDEVACAVDYDPHASSYSCTVADLEADSAYTLRLVQVFEWGEDWPWLDPDIGADALSLSDVAVTTTSGLPSAVTIRATAVTATSVTVEWDAADDGGFIVEFYSVIETATDNFCIVPGDTATSCTVSGLPEGESQTLVGVASNFIGDGDPTSPAVVVDTCTSRQRAYGTDCYDCYSEGCDGSAECTGRYSGVLCGDCDESYYVFVAGKCVACAGVPYEGLLLLVVVGAVVWYVRKLKGRSLVANSVIKGLVHVSQVSALVFSYTADLDDSARAMGTATSLVSIDIGKVHPECFAPGSYNFYVLYVATVFVQPVLFVMAFWAIDRALLRLPEGDKVDRRRARLRRGACFLGSMYFITFVATLLDTFNCVDTPEGRRLRADQDISCASGTHQTVEAVSAVLLLLSGVGVGVLFFILRRLRAQGSLDTQDVFSSYGGLYGRYRNEFATFECYLLMRKAAMVSVDRTLGAVPEVQVSIGLVFALAHVAVVYRRPYEVAIREVKSMSPALHRALKRRRLPTSVDVVNSLERVAATCMAALQVFVLIVVVFDVQDAAQQALLSLTLVPYAVYGVLAFTVLRSELSRGFEQPNLRVRGQKLRDELARVEALMRELAAREEYIVASELHRAVVLLRSYARGVTPDDEDGAVELVQVANPFHGPGPVEAEEPKADLADLAALAEAARPTPVFDPDGMTGDDVLKQAMGMARDYEHTLRQLSDRASSREMYDLADTLCEERAVALETALASWAKAARQTVEAPSYRLRAALGEFDFATAEQAVRETRRARAAAAAALVRLAESTRSWSASTPGTRRNMSVVDRKHRAQHASAALQRELRRIDAAGGEPALRQLLTTARRELQRGFGVTGLPGIDDADEFLRAAAKNCPPAPFDERLAEYRQGRYRLKVLGQLGLAALCAAALVGTAVAFIAIAALASDSNHNNNSGSAQTNGTDVDAHTCVDTVPYMYEDAACFPYVDYVADVTVMGYSEADPQEPVIFLDSVARALGVVMQYFLAGHGTDLCEATVVEAFCTMTFRRCDGNCTALSPCDDMCDRLRTECDPLDRLVDAARADASLAYFEQQFGPDYFQNFEAMMDLAADCATGATEDVFVPGPECSNDEEASTCVL